MHSIKGKRKGFTLIEMIVSIGVFLTGFLIILGALVSIDNAARKTRATRIVMDNLSAAIDSMSRTIRVGSRFNCGCAGNIWEPNSCPATDQLGAGGGTCLAFEGQHGNPLDNGDQIVYRLSAGRLERSINSGVDYLPLTAAELHISTFRFYVYGTDVNMDQPVATIVIRGAASTTAKTTTKFDVQTTIAAYTPNIQI